MCRKSLCVPYTNTDVDVTDEKGKISLEEPMKNFIGDLTEEEKFKENFGHIMISYNHSTRPICLKIAEALRVKKNQIKIVLETKTVFRFLRISVLSFGLIKTI